MKNLEKQPKGLYLLFFTGLWERCGFYTLQTILILYMTQSLRMADSQANLLYAAFNSLLYLTPLIGGYLADRYLGFQRAVLIGGILLVLAYAVAAFHSQTLFFLGLSILICANGLFKPNISSLVGELYQENDARRDGGFTLFYMGINLGALIPPIIAGTLVAHYGWHSGFVLAALGMLAGLITFMMGRKHLNVVEPVRQSISSKFYLLLSIGIVTVTGLCQLAFAYPQFTNIVVELAAVGIMLVILFVLFKEPIVQRKKMIASLILIVISIAFWALYNQAFSSLMLFADRNMEKHILGFPLNAEFTQFFNPFFIIALSPVLSRLWIRMDDVGLNPSTQMKFSLGVLFMCVGYLILAFGAKYFGQQGLISSWWLVGSYLLQTIGELLISPIGLAMITVLCPKHLVGLMMGVWFFSQAAAFAIGGVLANIAAVPAHASTVASLDIYGHAFTLYGVITLIAAVISLALVPLLTRMINSEQDSTILSKEVVTEAQPY